MERFRVEKDFKIDGYRCVIVAYIYGHRCGYIGIPRGHKLHGVNCDNINIPIHGGWTYSDSAIDRPYPVECNDLWWIGFDTGHCFDGKDIGLIMSFEPCDLTREIIRIESKYKTEGTIKDTEYLANELRRAVKEIKGIK